MKKVYLLLVGMLVTTIGVTFGQEEGINQDEVKAIISKNNLKDIPEGDSSNWTASVLFGLNGTQSSFVNWSAGGRNNLSLLGFIDGNASYRKNHIKWDNDLKLSLGGVRYFDNAPALRKFDKTDDRIDLSSTFGYEFKKNWLVTATTGFKTQMMNGYLNPTDSLRSSAFMAPGYFSAAIGIEYAPTKHLNVFLSPLALKYTFVNDQRLADEGQYGMQKAELDGLGNVVIGTGKRFRQEYGAYFRFIFNKELIKNIEMKSRLELFSNYIHKPQNIDVNAEVIFTFKVNSWLSASLQWNLIYDDDIMITDRNGNVGPRTQFKSILGLGVSYALKNQNAKNLK